MKHVIIDTDPGIDDTAAIFLALASPKLSVDALTTVYGNGLIEGLHAQCAHHSGDCRTPPYPGLSGRWQATVGRPTLCATRARP